MIEPKSMSKSPSIKEKGSSIDKSQYRTNICEEHKTDQSKGMLQLSAR